MIEKISSGNAKKQFDEVISSFTKRIKQTAGNNLRGIILYGSRARGDNSVHSDYDFIILLGSKDPTLIDKIRSVEVEMMDTYNVLISALVFTVNDWKKRQSLPLGLNVQREGITLG